MFCMLKKKNYTLVYLSKHNSNREKRVIILMILNQEKWHYLAVRKLSALLRGIRSKNDDDFYCLKCLHSFKTKRLESQKKVSENKNFCNIIMSPGDTEILESNQYQKSDKASFIIYADLEFIIEKIHGCEKNPENSSTTKVSEHIPSGFSISTISSF